MKTLDSIKTLFYNAIMIDSANEKNENKKDSEILRRRVYCNLLYDFYSPLLTERQRKVYETLCFSDLTLSEAADILGISRQGVYDLVRHVMEKLEGIEKELCFAVNTQKLENRIKELEEENKSLRSEIKKIKVEKEEN